MQAHGARVALLASDVADLNPARLQAAIARWVQHKPFLPKASELRAIVEDMALSENPTDREGLYAWCEEKNAWAKRIGADWWYRVNNREVDGQRTYYVEKLEGWRAREERARAEGNPIRWYKPTDADVAAIHAYAAKCAAEGMTQFNTHVHKTGGCPQGRG